MSQSLPFRQIAAIILGLILIHALLSEFDVQFIGQESIGDIVPKRISKSQTFAKIVEHLISGAYLVAISIGVLVGIGLLFAEPDTGINIINGFVASFVAVWTCFSFVRYSRKYSQRAINWCSQVRKISLDGSEPNEVSPKAVFAGTMIFATLYAAGVINMILNFTSVVPSNRLAVSLLIGVVSGSLYAVYSVRDDISSSNDDNYSQLD